MDCTHCGSDFKAEILKALHDDIRSRNRGKKSVGTCLTCAPKHPEETLLYKALTGGSGRVN